MNLLSRLADSFTWGAARARNKPFLEGAMASAALVATADGPASFAKRHTLDQILETVEALKIFEAHRAVDLFDTYSGEIQDAPEHGQAKAVNAISALAGDPKSAGILVRISCAIAKADGESSPRATRR